MKNELKNVWLNETVKVDSMHIQAQADELSVIFSNSLKINTYNACRQSNKA